MSSLSLITDRSEQLKIWTDLSSSISSSFSHKKEATWNDVFYGNSGEDEQPFGLEIWLRGEWLGCSLNGPLLKDSGRFGSILQFATYSNKSGTDLLAARLARQDNKILLLHDGRVYSDGRGSPWSDSKVEIGGKALYIVTNLDSNTFFRNIIKFHQSRTNPNIAKIGVPSTHLAIDPGQSKGGTRSQAYFEARHHPITMTLLNDLKTRGFYPVECEVFSPDLLVDNGQLRVLIEIKPTSTGHDLIVGCGQLLIYNQKANAYKLALVTPELNNSPYANEIRSFMAKNNIISIEFTNISETLTFQDLDVLLAGS